MPAKTPDAEAGTEVTAATGNVDTAVLLNDLSATQELVMRQEEMIQKLADQVAHLAATAASDSMPPVVVGPSLPTPVPEGHKRYASRFMELTLVKDAGRRIYVDGQGVVFEPAHHIDFQGGVFETGDEDTITWMDAHPEVNQTFWADETAIRRHSTVQVMPGVRTTEESPRAPLVAPMG